MKKLTRRSRSGLLVTVVVAVLVAALGVALAGTTANGATPPTLNLRVLLIGAGTGDPTSAAWQAALTSEGVPFTVATASGAYGSETVTLPTLSSGGVGDFNGVVIADSPGAFAAGQLTSLFSYESSFGVRQVDGYTYPNPALGITAVSGGPLDGTTGALTAAGLAALPELKGPVPFDTGTYGYPASVNSGAPFTSWLGNSAGNVLAGVYQHPGADPQGGVSELELTFNYNQNSLQWLLLAPGLINWVTQDTHLGLYRNYLGQDVDDVFIADNEWSRQYQCTPAATSPVDVGCPAAAQGNPAYGPPDQQLTAADVSYVTNWEQRTGIKLEFMFNAVGACSAPNTATVSNANCTGSATVNGTTYTDPGQSIDPSNPNDAGVVNALLTNQGAFNWTTHTWSHLFLGCVVWQPLPINPPTAGSGGSIAAGSYRYEVTAATAYGESEPSVPAAVSVGASGSVSLSWPDATNGGGYSLSQLEAKYSGGTGFWGYHVYRQNPGSTTFGLVGQVAENPAGTTSGYGFTDTGATNPGVTPGTTSTYPTATNPGIECSGTNGSGWTPATATNPANSIEGQIGLDDAFAANNGLTNWSPNTVVTGEHSGLENPNMPAALNGVGITTFGSDASRQPNVYTIGNATSAPRYPSNIYYNAANWPDQLNEYNTLYVAGGDNLGDGGYPSETGRCSNTPSTTCRTTAATEADLLASESRIMLGHVLANDPRMSYAHQSNLIGPATQTVNGVTSDYGYTLLTFLSDVLAQYNSWYNAPLAQLTDATSAQTMTRQAAWAAADNAGSVTATVQNGTVTVTNSSGSPVSVPVTVPAGTTVNGAAFGQSYGGTLSAWTSVAGNGSQILSESVAPTITSGGSANSIVGAPLRFTVYTTGAPAPALAETGALPSGITFTDNGNGTAALAGTAAANTGGSYPITITAKSTAGTATQSFTLTNAQAPAITSPSTATFTIGANGTYTVTTTGYPAPSITATGALPAGLTFADNGTGTATISGTPAAGGNGGYPVTISATNASGSTATVSLTITVANPSGPAITSGSAAYFTLHQSGAFAITTTGAPSPSITATGALPAGLTFVDNGTGTALLSGTPTATGSTNLTITATNTTGSATQSFSVIVGQAPAFSSPATASFTAGSSGSFTVTTTGYPAAALGESGALPSGLTFVDNHDGTATLSGTPAANTGGPYPVPLTAVNGTGTVHQTLTVTVNQSPLFTSAGTAQGAMLTHFGFTVTTTGYPAATITESGALPLGVGFTANANGTATISGTPLLLGSYKITLTAKNEAGAATQGLTISIGL